MPTTKTARNVILVGGDKGGVGKSATSRALTEYLDENSSPHIAFDGDDVNPTFLRFYPKAERIFTKSVKGFEVLINNLEAETPTQLVDLGAGTSLMFAQFAHKTDFLDEAAQAGAAVTFVFVLSPSVDSIHLLKILFEQYGERLRYVIAKSEALPGNWDLWAASKTREALLKANAVEITIPALDADAFALADRYSLSWDAAGQDTRLPLASRSYLKRWRKQLFSEFDKAASLLLLS
jgi:hypothetical protein